jgi:hypothetical protein
VTSIFRRRALGALIGSRIPAPAPSPSPPPPPPPPPGTTIGDLGYLGVNMAGSNDYTFGYLHNNVLLDTRGFTAPGTGGTTTPLDANGLPTGSATLCFNTTPDASTNGPVAPGNYWLNVYSVGQTVTATLSGHGYVTMGAGVAQGDGITIRYPVTVASTGMGVSFTAFFTFSGAMSAMPEMARNGAPTMSGLPVFCDDALVYYSQFSVIRAMDFLNPNLRTDTSWATRPGNWPLRAYGGTNSWEKLVALFNAIAAYPGSKLKNVLINIPISADTSYAGFLSAYLNTLGLTSSVQVYVQRANEHWNTGQAAYWPLLNLGVAELNCVANYGVATPTITSIGTDGTNATFTFLNPVSTYIPGATVGTTTPCVVVGGAFGFTVGTKAAPATATVTGTNTLTVPTTATWNSTANGGIGGYVGIVFNLASSLVADGVMPDVFHAGAKYWVRQTWQDQQAWAVNRPQDRFFLDMSISNGSGNAGGGSSIPIEMTYAAYLGGGMPTWLYAVAPAPYVQSTTASTNLNALFTELNGLITSKLDGQVRSYRYWANLMGLHLMAYEMGPDLQATPSLVVQAMTDARMNTVQASLLNMWFSNGGEHVAAFTGTPGAFTNVAQGGWPIAQSYTDTTSPKLAAILAYFTNTISLANVYGSPGTIDIPSRYEAGSGAVLNGMFGWFSAGKYVDVMAAIPVAGSYTLTLNGTSKLSNVVTFYLDPTISSNGANIGNSTLVATGGGWNVDNSTAAVPVSNPITLTLAAGIHTLRLFPTAVSTGGAALKSITTLLH